MTILPFKKMHLIIIDPQVDFCEKSGTLYVPGAYEDMKRLAGLIDSLGNMIHDIHLSLDTHYEDDISHPCWFRNKDGYHPEPFTQITPRDLLEGEWLTTNPEHFEYTLWYLNELEKRGKYKHTIWPYHCLINDRGRCIVDSINNALQKYSKLNNGYINHIVKGNNPNTEHFSIVSAEVPLDEYPDTNDNMKLINTLDDSEIVLIGGEASSHCVASTVLDLIDKLKKPNRIMLLSDATSPVPGFEDQAWDMIHKLLSVGGQFETVENATELINEMNINRGR